MKISKVSFLFLLSLCLLVVFMQSECKEMSIANNSTELMFSQGNQTNTTSIVDKRRSKKSKKKKKKKKAKKKRKKKQKEKEESKSDDSE